MSQSDVVDAGSHHAARSYHQDPELIESVAQWIVDGLERGHGVIVLATAAHVAAFEAAMVAAGHDPQTHRSSGRYRPVDADQLIAEFVTDGQVHRDDCLRVCADILAEQQQRGTPVRIFGEMVARLWEQGEESAALELEALWNEMAAGMPFNRVTAYSLAPIGGADLGQLRRVAEIHPETSPVDDHPAAPWPGLDDVTGRGDDQHTELFLPVPEAVAGVRRFVAAVLQATQPRAVVLDAALVASELAANAYLHAGGAPFRATVRQQPGRVRVSVEDRSPDRVRPTRPGHDQEHGRGVAIIDAISERWGCESLPTGKVVWAEIAAR